MTFRSLLITGAIALTMQATCAVAGPIDDAPSMVIHYSDLDLTRPAGVAALYHRITLAAALVCEPAVSRDLSRIRRYRACTTQAISNAITQVRAPLLAKQYAAVNH